MSAPDRESPSGSTPKVPVFPARQQDRLANRLPSRAEVMLLYAAAAVPIHTWAVLIFFHALPAYLLRMSIGSALSILAYVLSLALIESLLITGLLVFVCLALPEKFFKRYCVPQGAWVFWIIFSWGILAQFQNELLGWLNWNFTIYQVIITIWVISFVGVLFGGSLLLRRQPRFGASLQTIADKFSLLAGVYLALDLVSLLTVLIRNLSGS